MHPAGLARGECDFIPIKVVIPLEGNRLAAFHRRNHRGVCTLSRAQIDEAIGIINHPGSLRSPVGCEGQHAGDENEANGFHLRCRTFAHATDIHCFAFVSAPSSHPKDIAAGSTA